MTLRLKRKGLFEVQSNSLRYFHKKAKIKRKKGKKLGRSESLIYMIGNRRLSVCQATISDVTTGQLQNVCTSLQILFIVIFGTYFFNCMIVLNDYSREQLKLSMGKPSTYAF